MSEWYEKLIGKAKEHQIGDKVAIWMSNHKGRRTHGTVVHKFDLDDDMSSPFYVIRIETPVDPHYEVRCGWPLEMIAAKDDNTNPESESAA